MRSTAPSSPPRPRLVLSRHLPAHQGMIALATRPGKTLHRHLEMKEYVHWLCQAIVARRRPRVHCLCHGKEPAPPSTASALAKVTANVQSAAVFECIASNDRLPDEYLIFCPAQRRYLCSKISCKGDKRGSNGSYVYLVQDKHEADVWRLQAWDGKLSPIASYVLLDFGRIECKPSCPGGT